MRSVRALLLAAGVGSRLAPLTDNWPKCLMPISGRPLLEYWLYTLYSCGFKEVLVNTHYMSAEVQEFLGRDQYKGWVKCVHELELLGTAGSLVEHSQYFANSRIVVIHADNLCQCEFQSFLDFHNRRPSGTVMTMMTFRTNSPESCGIVSIDSRGVVQEFFEKCSTQHGNIANGAVYILEESVLEWALNQSHVQDFSLDVIPEFIGRIATWENVGVHRDIGTVDSLVAAQSDPVEALLWENDDLWNLQYRNHPIHRQLESLM